MAPPLRAQRGATVHAVPGAQQNLPALQRQGCLGAGSIGASGQFVAAGVEVAKSRLETSMEK